MFEGISNWVLQLVQVHGGLGVLIGMFLESSIVPIPSELVLVTAGLLGINIFYITFFGAIGSTLGSIVGYYIGRHAGRPFIDHFGKYFFLSKEHIKRAENWFKRFGKWTILISRLIPIIPFKVFSITAGVLKMDLPRFLVFTFIGTIPRAFLLGWIGLKIMEAKISIFLALGVAVVVLGVLYYFVNKKKIV